MNLIKPERINPLINLIRNSGRICMTSWQSTDTGVNVDFYHNRRKVETVEQLHTCKNHACIGGYLALLSEFKEAGGTASPSGAPRINGLLYDHAVAYFLAGALDTDPATKDWVRIFEAVITGKCDTRDKDGVRGTLRVPTWYAWGTKQAVAVLEWLRDFPGTPTPHEFIEFAYGLSDKKNPQYISSFEGATWRLN